LGENDLGCGEQCLLGQCSERRGIVRIVGIQGKAIILSRIKPGQRKFKKISMQFVEREKRVAYI
jgi:hypothetical protein